MRDSYERLRDRQEAIMHIMKYTSQGRDLFYHDELVQIWVIHHLEIIGEATRTIPDDFRNFHPEIPWKQINAMRNILVHLYFDINLDRVWAVVEQDLPVLKTSVDAILASQDYVLLDTFKGGVWLVDLASLSDPALVPQTVASVFGLREMVGQSQAA